MPLRAFCDVGNLGPATLAKAFQGVVITTGQIINHARAFKSQPLTITKSMANRYFPSAHQCSSHLNHPFIFMIVAALKLKALA